MAKKVTKAACERKGGTYVHFKSSKSSVCFGKSKKRKGSRRGKKGIAKMSTAARKAMMRKVCSRVSATKKKKMAGLCRWARS